MVSIRENDKAAKAKMDKTTKEKKKKRGTYGE